MTMNKVPVKWATCIFFNFSIESQNSKPHQAQHSQLDTYVVN